MVALSFAPSTAALLIGVCSGRADHLPRIRRLGLPAAWIYDFRHLSTTYSIAAGIDPRTTADRASHKNPAYMIRRCSHAVAAAQDRSAEVAAGCSVRAKPAGVPG